MSPQKGHWAESLEKAGLLDEIDDTWVLPDGEIEAVTIEVSGSGGADIPDSMPPVPAPQREDGDEQPVRVSYPMILPEAQATAERPSHSSGKGRVAAVPAAATRSRRSVDTDPFDSVPVNGTAAAEPPPREDPFAEIEKPAREDPFAEIEKPVREDPFAEIDKPVREDPFVAVASPADEDPFATVEKPAGDPIETPPADRRRADISTAPPVPRRKRVQVAEDSWGEEEPVVRGSVPPVVEVLGSRITVPPAALDNDAQDDTVGTIIDEPIVREASIPAPPLAPPPEGVPLSPDPGPGAGDQEAPAAPEAPAPEAPADTEAEARLTMKERFDLGDYSGALEISEQLIAAGAADEDLRLLHDECRRVLLQMYESRIGPLDRVPVVAVDMKEIIWRNLDPSSGFVVSRVDGHGTFEDIIDISGLPRFENCRILDALLQDGIIK
jgi:hypothetical protein